MRRCLRAHTTVHIFNDAVEQRRQFRLSNESCSVDLSDLPAIKIPFELGQMEHEIGSFSPTI